MKKIINKNSVLLYASIIYPKYGSFFILYKEYNSDDIFFVNIDEIEWHRKNGAYILK